jgi:hypothetical protein
MKQNIIRNIAVGAMLAVSLLASAQDLNSAYFTDNFTFRHDMNPAFANSHTYISLPALGNFNIGMQGNIGVGDVLFKNPDPTGKKTVTFMHPNISYDQALSGISSNGVKTRIDSRITLLSAGFKAFGGYNTIEVNNRLMAGVSLPRSLFEFAKGISNQDYRFDDISVRGMDFVELALGHSHAVNRQLRIGAKVKLLLGGAMADLTVSNMRATLVGDTWQLQGQAKAEVNMKGVAFKRETKEYKSRPGTYEQVTGFNTDDAGGLGGMGLAADLGAVYRLTDDVTLSAALTDLGFISWNSTTTARNSGQPFTFNGFHDVAVKDEYASPGQTMDEQTDSYADQIADFVNLEGVDDAGGKTTSLSATARLGAEYTLPGYRRLSAGLVLAHHFGGSNFSWTEGRLSANWKPLSWLDGGVSVGVNTFATNVGWVVNIHPKGFNFFVGMDRFITKVNNDNIPMSPNASLNFGFNVIW